MCGIAGFVGRVTDSEEIARRMATVLGHRGPDDEGVWVDKEAGVALSHRRLSILDLSPAGHQPMISHCSRYVIVFNGEIYNHLELRRKLEKETFSNASSCMRVQEESVPGAELIKWRGHSDTETILTAIEKWGVEATLNKCVGMFAFALWDRETHTLVLARDRMGEKPLYYGWQGEVFLFGSEIKALMVHPAFRAEIDRNNLALFFRHSYIISPYSIYKGINKLPPGTYLKISVGRPVSESQHTPRPYWNLQNVVKKGTINPFKGTEREAADELERLLLQSIRGQMIADVPVGVFLSGGIDSSTVAALMQAQSDQPVRTFTIGFYEDDFNEAEHARAVAENLGTDHTELYVTAEQAMHVISLLPTLYNEPFADSSQIPTFLISKLARQHVKVCLSGDGGDELFGGYSRYFWAPLIYRKIGRLPLPLRLLATHALTRLQVADPILKAVCRFHQGKWASADLASKFQRFSTMLDFDSPEDLYMSIVSHYRKPSEIVKGTIEPNTVLIDPSRWIGWSNFEHRMMYLDQMSYLPEDILVKVDRAAMGVSLETRIPLLDHRIVEFAWRLPLSMKIRDGQSKWLLRQVLYRYVPRDIVERPKRGFSVPIGDWLRGPLRDWAEALLDEKNIREDGLLNPAPIRAAWTAHLEGKHDWSPYLWDVLMFQTWLERIYEIHNECTGVV